MKIFTEVSFAPSAFKIAHSDQILFLGSCFANEMHQRAQDGGFCTAVNPFGTVFNPHSLAKQLKRIQHQELFEEEELVLNRALYHHFDVHHSFSQPKARILIDQVNNELTKAHQFISKAKVAFVTLGSAFVYRHKELGEWVSNCHQIPSTEFEKELMSIEQLTTSLLEIKHTLSGFGVDHIVFTVSPVRHFKDGLVENARSKARLLEAVHHTIHQSDQCFYFPSYEFILDELRDYRWFNEDLLHPNQQAVSLVWEKFKEVFFSEETIRLAKEVQNVNRALAHKVQHEGTKAHGQFLQTQLSKIAALENLVNLEDQKQAFQKRWLRYSANENSGTE